MIFLSMKQHEIKLVTMQMNICLLGEQLFLYIKIYLIRPVHTSLKLVAKLLLLLPASSMCALIN